ncbi:MAG: molybdopterin-dependent oxidoreductase [Janthinobacterium lividum]
MSRAYVSIAALGMLFLALGMTDVAAESLPAPKGKVVLTLSGPLTETNGPGVATFDMEMLDALPQHTIVTTSPWYKTPAEFRGPLLEDVLARIGARGHAVMAHAINDYDVEIPAEDASRGLVLATRRDGKPMPLSDKGPIFAMYPFDSNPDLKKQVYFSRCVWELESLIVE